ncbi:hypothetical protein MTP99_018316 [Tenebrio molitor]|nr:hypothetical protein MTP99_018316 [Tenebrio molitor]
MASNKVKLGRVPVNTGEPSCSRAVTSLHNSIKTYPDKGATTNAPRSLRVSLMPHQKSALAWLLWRETQTPPGGILADDMGLGKTIMMIAHVLKSKEEEVKAKRGAASTGGTLVVCPASVMNQWEAEVKQTTDGSLSVNVHHGPRRETNAKSLSRYDLVLTTYGIVRSESNKNGAVTGVKWRRIILDEAHQIRNDESLTAEAVCRLSAQSRWALTGTPVHNKDKDMYSMLKFLRCPLLGNAQAWKRWVEDKEDQKRLHAVISSLMLRRTKEEMVEKGLLQTLPEKKLEMVNFQLDKDEMEVYLTVLAHSKTLFWKFLEQKGLKRDVACEVLVEKLQRGLQTKPVTKTTIFVLLLRLRQICCHPCLIMQKLPESDNQRGPQSSGVLPQLKDIGSAGNGTSSLDPTDPIFREDHQSTKIKVLLDLLKIKVSRGDKAIVVSQWTSLLGLVSTHISKEKIPIDTLDGSVEVKKRMSIVDNFNNPRSKTKVLLLSLTAGGVGLNLVGANHLFILDLHWNPQLENQAQDRIYRMGQIKPVFVYRFMALGTIEERIKELQDMKMEFANSMFKGSKQVLDDNLSLQDLQLLFK